MVPRTVPSDWSLVPQEYGNGLPAPHAPELPLISAHDKSPATPATHGPDCQKLKPTPAPIRPPSFGTCHHLYNRDKEEDHNRHKGEEE